MACAEWCTSVDSRMKRAAGGSHGAYVVVDGGVVCTVSAISSALSSILWNLSSACCSAHMEV
eukprot:4259653-Pyramimonas_sp.AAC.1